MKNGKRYLFGGGVLERVSRPVSSGDIFADTYCWNLSSFTDTSGNTITYNYTVFSNSPGILYPAGITYAQFGQFSHSIEFTYTGSTRFATERTDIFTDYRPGFPVVTGKLLREVAVKTDGALVRRYVLGYSPDPFLDPPIAGEIPLGFSRLCEVKQLDRSGSDQNFLPPIRFSYSRFNTVSVSSVSPKLRGVLPEKTIPPPSFQSVTGGANFLRFRVGCEVADINADGLPDFVASSASSGWFAYLNKGRNAFTGEIPFSPSEADGKTLASDGVTLADLDGDGVSDLAQKNASSTAFSVYRNVNGPQTASKLDETDVVTWGNRQTYSNQTNSATFSSFSITDPSLRMLDLDFDKRIDFMRPYSVGSSSGVTYFYNRLAADGSGNIWVSETLSAANARMPADWVANEALFLSDPSSLRRADLSDMNGDRLQDWYTVQISTGGTVQIRYWPNANGGAWATRHSMETLNVPGIVAEDLRLMDVNADGLSDLVLVQDRKLQYWINIGNDQWSDPITRSDAPTYHKTSGGTLLRQGDFNGNGTTDLFWDNGNIDPVNLPQGMTQYMLFDFVSGTKPGILSVIDNGIGRMTTIEYKSSIYDYLTALQPDSRGIQSPWTTKLPFPVQVVARIVVNIGLDLDGDANPDQYITDINYRDGYYDSFEKEFRGFAYAEKIDRGDDYNPATGQTTAGTGTVSGPTQVIRNRFFTGSPDGFDNDQYPSNYNGQHPIDEGSGTGLPITAVSSEIGGREEEPLKGKPVFVEILDGAILTAPASENASFQVCARASALAANTNPFSTAAQRCAPDKYVYTRTHTDWKVRRLYRPTTLASPAGRFPATTLVPKSVSFALSETIDKEIFEANGLLSTILNSPPVDYPVRPPKTTRQVSAFDDYGNQTLAADYGVIIPGTPDDLAVGDDERIKKTTYALNGNAISNWIIDRPAIDRTEDENGIFASETRHYYDGSELVGMPLGQVGTRGLEKRTESVVTENPATLLPLASYDEASINHRGDPRLAAGSTVNSSRIAYDIYGNSLAIMDPLGSTGDIQLLPNATAPTSALAITGNHGHFRIISYDANRHSYPVAERIVLGNSKDDLVMAASYDPGIGVMTASTEFNGKNTNYSYDSFSRLVSIVKPFDSATFPTQSFIYRPADPFRREVYNYTTTGSLAITVPPATDVAANTLTTRLREKAGQSGTFDTIQYTSGQKQPLMTVEEDEYTTRFVVKSAIRYNHRGSSAAMYQPYWRSDSKCHIAGVEGIRHDELPLTDTDCTNQKYDGTGRLFEALNPPETVAGARSRVVSEFLPLEQRIFDEEDSTPGSLYAGTPMVQFKDGLGRLVQVDEVTRLDDEGTRTASLRSWSTHYKYDLGDGLVQILDSQNNRKWMRYDGLGRKIFMNDLNRGVMNYTHDSASNLVQTIDAKSQAIQYAYDGANRLQSEDYLDEGLPFSANRSPDVSYTYDVPAGIIDLGNGEKATAANTKGILSWISDLSGEEHNSYDDRGRVKWVVKRIPDRDSGSLVSYKTELNYDSMDRVETLKYPDEDKIAYGYNNRSLISRIIGGSSVNLNDNPFIGADMHYLPAGALHHTSYGNGVMSDQLFDPRLRLRSISAARINATANPIISYDYEWDRASNITKILDRRAANDYPAGDNHRNTQMFSYDDLYRITNVQYSFNLPGQPVRDDGRISWNYDRIGNMLNQNSSIIHIEDGLQVTNLGTMAYGSQAGRLNRIGRNTNDAGCHALTRIGTDRNYSYDANGNITVMDGLTLTSDFKDRIVKATSDKSQTVYTYDYSDRRIAKSTRGLSTSGNSLEPETSTLYIDKHFEIRSHGQSTKHVYNGNLRVASINGVLDPASDQVQRIRLLPSWNLVYVAVQSTGTATQLGILGDNRVRSAFIWDHSLKTFVSLSANMLVPANSILWVCADANVTLTVRGKSVSGFDFDLPVGGAFVPGSLFTSLNVLPFLNTARVAIWMYDSNLLRWEGASWVGPTLRIATASNLRLPAGNAFYVDSAASSTLAIQQKEAGITYYHSDHLGSVSALTNGYGDVIEQYNMYPFGCPRTFKIKSAQNIESPDNTVYAFLQKELDQESGLHYFEARYLSSKLGRFTRPDMIQIESNPGLLVLPQQLNSYAYCANQPLSISDRNGMSGSNTFLDFVTGGEFSADHQRAIDAALGRKPELSNMDIATIKNQQSVMDKLANQTQEFAFRHAMRAPEQTVEQAKELANAWIYSELQQARRDLKTGTPEARKEAMEHFGNALHTIQDAISPEHANFQVWGHAESGLGGLFWRFHGLGWLIRADEVVEHVLGERKASPQQMEEMSKVTNDTWDDYVAGKKEIPKNFLK